MSAVKKIALVVVALLLVTTVATANVVMTSEKTALNAEFVDQSITEEDGYDQLQSATTNAVLNEVEKANITESDQIPSAISSNINTTAIVEESITTEYVRNQSRANLYRLYAFLHGDRQDPGLGVDLVPLKRSLSSAVGSEIADVDISTLIDEYAPSTADAPIEITGERFERMRSSQSGYREVRGEFRDEVREIVFDRLREEDPGLLLEAIGINPNDYNNDAERRQAVDDNEAEIKQQMEELTRQGADNRIKDRFDRELVERANDAKDRIRQETREQTSEFSPNITQAAIDIQVTVIDGLATDTSYEEFSTRIDSAEQTLADEASRLARQRINDEVPDNISAAEELSAEDREQLNALSDSVQQIDTANSVLPFVALVLIGLIYVISRSLETTALTTGIAVGFVGLVTYVGAMVVQTPVSDLLREQLSGENTEAIRDLAIGLVEQTLGVLQSQSLLLLVAGLVLTGLAVASKLGAFDRLRERGSETAAGAGAAGVEAGGQPPQQSAQGQPTQGQQSFEGPGQPPKQEEAPGRAPGQAGLGDDGVDPLEVGGDDDGGTLEDTDDTGTVDSLGDDTADSGSVSGVDGGDSSDDAGGSDPLGGDEETGEDDER